MEINFKKIIFKATYLASQFYGTTLSKYTLLSGKNNKTINVPIRSAVFFEKKTKKTFSFVCDHQ